MHINSYKVIIKNAMDAAIHFKKAGCLYSLKNNVGTNCFYHEGGDNPSTKLRVLKPKRPNFSSAKTSSLI